MAKNLITTIQVNFVLIRSEAGMRQCKLNWIVVIKIFPINLYHHSHFLAAPFHFSHWPFWTGPHLFFLQPGCFWVDSLNLCLQDYKYFCQVIKEYLLLLYSYRAFYTCLCTMKASIFFYEHVIQISFSGTNYQATVSYQMDCLYCSYKFSFAELWHDLWNFR